MVDLDVDARLEHGVTALIGQLAALDDGVVRVLEHLAQKTSLSSYKFRASSWMMPSSSI